MANIGVAQLVEAENLNKSYDSHSPNCDRTRRLELVWNINILRKARRDVHSALERIVRCRHSGEKSNNWNDRLFSPLRRLKELGSQMKVLQNNFTIRGTPVRKLIEVLGRRQFTLGSRRLGPRKVLFPGPNHDVPMEVLFAEVDEIAKRRRRNQSPVACRFVNIKTGKDANT